MSDNTSQPDGDEQARDGERRHGSSLSRRTFMKATGASAGAVALGTASTGPAGAISGPQIPTPRLSVDGNTIVDPGGNTVKLRGLNIADPKRMAVEAPAMGKTAPQAVDFLTDKDRGWYPRVIRIPVQPIDIGEHVPGNIAGPPAPPAFTVSQLESYLETYLDPVIERCGERGVYAIVDFHRHWTSDQSEWDGTWAAGQNGPINEALQDEVATFWDVVAPRYADEDHVIYEVYNEPTEPGMWGDPTQENWVADIWSMWVEMAQPWVDTIRDHADNLLLMGSPSWSQSPEGALVEPFQGGDIAYTYHIYGGHDVSTTSRDWGGPGPNGDGLAGVHEEYPVVVTEFGWAPDIDPYITGTTPDFGEPFLEFLESHDSISWTAWCAHPTWEPAMFERAFDVGDAEPYENPYEEPVPEYCADLPCEWNLLGEDVGEYDRYSGAKIKETLEAHRNDLIPEGDVGPPDPTGPEPPADLAVETGDTSIDVTWTGDADAVAYNVYVDGDLETETSETGATIAGLEPDTTYEVAVTAVGEDGAETEPSRLEATTDDGSGDPDPDAPTITVDLATEELDPGETTTATFAIENAPDNGLTGWDIEVAVDPDVAQIVEIELSEEWAALWETEFNRTLEDEHGGAASSFLIGEVNSLGTIEEGDTAYGLGTYHLEAQADGVTSVDLVSFALTDGDGEVHREANYDAPTLTVGDTDPDAPQTPADLAVVAESETSIELDWASDPNAAGYTVYVDGAFDHETGTSGTTVTGLEAETSYEIGVSAVGADGTETDVATVQATTAAEDPDADYPEWDPAEIYNTGDRVSWNGENWEAQWWTRNQEPRYEEYYVWQPVDGELPPDDPGEPEEPDGVFAELDPTATSVETGERVGFHVHDTTDDQHWVTDLQWDFGDGTTGSGWWNAHTYDSPGTYAVALTATDNEGRETTHEVAITVS